MPRQVGNAGRVVVGAPAIRAWLDFNKEGKRPVMARLAAVLERKARPAAMARLAAVLRRGKVRVGLVAGRRLAGRAVALLFYGLPWKLRRASGKAVRGTVRASRLPGKQVKS